jgi:hypothetical protein
VLGFRFNILSTFLKKGSRAKQTMFGNLEMENNKATNRKTRTAPEKERVNGGFQLV